MVRLVTATSSVSASVGVWTLDVRPLSMGDHFSDEDAGNSGSGCYADRL